MSSYTVLDWYVGLLAVQPTWAECRELTNGAVGDGLHRLVRAIDWYLRPEERSYPDSSDRYHRWSCECGRISMVPEPMREIYYVGHCPSCGRRFTYWYGGLAGVESPRTDPGVLALVAKMADQRRSMVDAAIRAGRRFSLDAQGLCSCGAALPYSLCCGARVTRQKPPRR